MEINKLTALILTMIFSLGLWGATSVYAQPEKPPQLEGGTEKKERVRHPVSFIILQKRYPDTLVLRGAQTENKVALTFDDGPDPRFTPKILDVLKENKVKATFFLMGARAAAYPNLVKRIKAEGHIIGNHTYWHPNLVKQEDISTLQSEVMKTEKTLEGLIGYRTKLFRAPYGFLNNELVEKIKEMNYSVIAWSVDSLDWYQSPPEQIAYNVISNIHPGAIILMHDGADWDEDRTNTIKSLSQIIPALKKQGLTFETVPELVKIPYKK